jgi:hypothetical protein
LISIFCKFLENSQINRFLHTFLGKTGWSSTSDINFMSFREWSAAKRAKRHKNFYHERKITRAFPTTHVSTYFFVNQQLSLSRTHRDARHWSLTNWHKLSDQYRWALWNTHHIKLTFVTPTNKLSSFLLILELFSLIFYWKYSIFLHETWNMTDTYFDVIEEWRQRYGKGHLEIRKNENKRHKYIYQWLNP